MTPILRCSVSERVEIAEETFSREDFFSWLWSRLGDQGLQGIHEGSMTSEEAQVQGLAVNAWTVDSAQAPHNRDWIGNQTETISELYFTDEASARESLAIIAAETSVTKIELAFVAQQDWNAEWRASFKGIDLPPYWRVLPPWEDAVTNATPENSSARVLKINPGAGFGTGTHETTGLCLESLGVWAAGRSLQGLRFLDFGSGSGILAIGAAALGAHGDAVEIDDLAIDNARENATLNNVQEHIRFFLHLPDDRLKDQYGLIFANILRPVLVEFADALCQRLAPNGFLILSGLIASDVPEVQATYLPRLQKIFGEVEVTVRERGEWRAITFQVS